MFCENLSKISPKFFEWNNEKIKRVYLELKKLKIVRIGSGFESSKKIIYPFCIEYVLNELCKDLDKNSLIFKSDLLSRHVNNLNKINNDKNMKELEVCIHELGVIFTFVNELVKGNKRNAETILIRNSAVVFSTLNSSAKKQLKVICGNISNVIIDEASQATEVQTLIPLNLKPERMILIGDPCQLPATTFHPLSKRLDFNRSCMERLNLIGFKMSMLKVQYRMLPLIAKFPSQTFYSNSLINDIRLCEISNQPENIRSVINDVGVGKSVRFFNCKGITLKNRNSFYNKTEVDLVHKIVRKIWDKNVRDIGVISPYSEQSRQISNKLRENEIFGVECSTVDSFQGREKDVIIISTVRSLDERTLECDSLGFLVDQRRLNVSITRAKFLLIVIGNKNTLKNDEIWKRYIDFLENEDLMDASFENWKAEK